jgi:hypothetical protein
MQPSICPQSAVFGVDGTQCSLVGVTVMVGTSWYHCKADECARSAEKSVDPGIRSRMKVESRLWRQIAVSQALQDEAPTSSRRG